jgi:ACT domain
VSGEWVYEFVVGGRDEIGGFAKVIEIFSKHNANIRSIYEAPSDEEKHEFVSNMFCDLKRADCTVEQLLKELRNLPFVRRAYSADMRGRLFDKFLFPVFVMKNRAILFRAQPLLNIEKRLIERFGSSGGAIMFDEGKAYAEETVRQYKVALPGVSSDVLLENIQDGLRATGWGIFDFWRIPEGFEVTVSEPPIMEDKSYKEDRFLYGAVAKMLESLYGEELALSTSSLDEKTKKLVFRLRRVTAEKK